MGTNEVLAIALKALKKGGGGGGGTSNYNSLTNKPQINGVTLSGNKTSADLNIADLSSLVAEEFDKDTAYSVGDIVLHEENLYQFIEEHTSGDSWDANEVSQTTVSALIRSIHHMVADDFDASSSYDIGDIVIYEGILYQFISPYTANSGWDNSKVQVISIEDLIIAYIRDIKTDIEDMVAEQFDVTKPYAIGDIVIYEDVLYRFTEAHAVGAWDITEVEDVNTAELINERPIAVEISQSDYDALSTAEKHDPKKVYYIYDAPGGGGGTDDYNDLENKPNINGVTLVGNKSLDDLGLDSSLDEYDLTPSQLNNLLDLI